MADGMLEAVAHGRAVDDWDPVKVAVGDVIKALFFRYNRDFRDPVEIPGLPVFKRAMTPAREVAAAAEHGASKAAGANHSGQLVPPPRQGSPPLVLPGGSSSLLADLSHGASGAAHERSPERSSSTLPSSPSRADPTSIAAKPAIRNDDATVLALQREVFELLDRHTSPPFTLQRLCEVLSEPERYYQTAAKLTRGVHKLLLIDPQFNAFVIPTVQENELDDLFAPRDTATEEWEDEGSAAGGTVGASALANGESSAGAMQLPGGVGLTPGSSITDDATGAVPSLGSRVGEKRGRSPDDGDDNDDNEGDEGDGAMGSGDATDINVAQSANKLRRVD